MREIRPEDERLFTEVVDVDGLPLVRAAGEIDIYSVTRFEKSMREAAARGARAIIIDLSEVSYLDSSGLSAIIVTYKALASRNAELYVVAPPGRHAIRRVLEITRIDQVVHVTDSLGTALDELRLPHAA